MSDSATFPCTFVDDNPEDRDYTGDLWAWLKHQPQDAWLLWARHANWDNATAVFEAMVDDPACDRALAAWLFWNSSPAHYLRHPQADAAGSLAGRIAHHAERGFYQSSDLFLNQHEICFAGLDFAAALKARTEPSPALAVPRSLCGPFAGRPARIPERYAPAIEAGLAEVFRYRDGWLPRSEAEHGEWMRKSGNLWTLTTLKLPDLPPDPTAKFAHLSDPEFLEAVFGKPEELEIARRRACQASCTEETKPSLLDRFFYGGAAALLRWLGKRGS